MSDKSPSSVVVETGHESTADVKSVNADPAIWPQTQPAAGLDYGAEMFAPRDGVSTADLPRRILAQLYHKCVKLVKIERAGVNRSNDILWLPLRRLILRDGPYDLGKLFDKEYFSHLKNKDGQRLAHALLDATARNGGRTLFILDGLDEVSGVWRPDRDMSRRFLESSVNFSANVERRLGHFERIVDGDLRLRVQYLQNWLRSVSSEAEAGHASVVDLLLSEGVEPGSVDSNGYTPLSYASKRGHETVVRRLLLENVNVHWRCNVFGRKSTSTLYTARINGQEAMTMLFDGSTTASVGDFFHTYAGGHEDCVKVIRLIARMDSSEYERIRSGISPLLISTDPTLGRVELFLVRGNDNSTVHGKTPLHLAAWQGHTNVVQLLLGIGGATPYSRDECNDTPLISAVAAGHRNVVKLLLSTAEVYGQAVDAQGMTALSWAT
ncbi:hypothetical protein PCL_07010 [Purpureocillium lilacinum]|uniref:Uncharacterized protein n=1 Tax=Purpureocillium lilacinum TaxID=33203 RepID=A0A2U3DTL2_PURLI|nr:hypothetical protein PCL_07010 [Purpureocillium lilacinum]